MTINRRKGQLMAAVCGAAIFVGGCGSVPLISGSGAGECYTMPQTMMIVTTERNRYEEVYTDAIWQTQVEGVAFEDYLLEQVETFLENMKAMNLLAGERSVELSAEDKEAMDAAADAYFEALSAEDKEAMKLSKEDASLMFEEYCLANQLVESLTSDMNLEVSDNEAKVIVIKEARTTDAQAAQSAAAALAQEDADFDRVMSNAGIPVTEKRLGRGEAEPAFEEAVFALDAGDVSSQLSDGESMCFVQCVSVYDEEATRIRKEQIYQERQRNAFRQMFDQFGAEAEVSYPEKFFDEITFDGEALAVGADFFTIYKTYMEERTKH